jgi:hypothetical protein
MTLIIIRMDKQNNKETTNKPKQPFRATNSLWSSSNNKKKTNKNNLTNFKILETYPHEGYVSYAFVSS